MQEISRQPSRAQWLKRLASLRKGRTAFVLSGGGALGALQVGAMKALFGAGVRPDLVVGTSVGAVNGAFVAFDPSPSGIDFLERVWKSMRHTELVPGSRFRTPWARAIVRGDHIFENVVIRDLVTSRFGAAAIEESRIPLGIVTSHLGTGDERVFTSGPLLAALLASTALPGVFPPVRIGDDSYIDGGVANNVPIGPAADMGAFNIYAIDATSASMRQKRPLLRPIDHLMHAFALARSQRVRVEAPVVAARTRLVMVPMPEVDVYVPFGSMRHTEHLIAIAYEHVARFLATSAGRQDSAVS